MPSQLTQTGWVIVTRWEDVQGNVAWTHDRFPLNRTELALRQLSRIRSHAHATATFHKVYDDPRDLDDIRA